MFFGSNKQLPIGVDISDNSIEVLQLSKKKEVLAYGRVVFKRGIVDDGKILDANSLKEKIEKLFENTIPQKVQSKKVILSLPESKTFFRVLKLPGDLKEKDLWDMAREEALKMIPLSPDKITSDFKVLLRSNDFQEVLYVGASNNIINEYTELFKDIGMEVVALDLESNSFARAFRNDIAQGGATLIADIGARTTVLTIFDMNSIRHNIIIPLAGNRITKAIAEKFNVSLREAEKLKTTCGLNMKKNNGNIAIIIQEALQEILKKSKKLIKFYEEETGRKTRKILLCGGSSIMPGLDLYVSSVMKIKTQIADPWKGIDVENLLSRKEFKKIIRNRFHPIFFSNVIGLALRGIGNTTGGINLIKSFKKIDSEQIALNTIKKSRNMSLQQLDDGNNIKQIIITVFAIIAFVVLGFVVYKYLFLKIVVQDIGQPKMEIQEPIKPSQIIEEPVVQNEEAALEEGELRPEDSGREVIEPKSEIVTVISDISTGWLNVREGPGTNYSILIKIYPGESYPLLEESGNWYKIKFGNNQEGWVYSVYVTK